MNHEKPIIFSTPMVQAILAGRKTQTRRIVKSKSVYIEALITSKVPYKPGDVLYVRETWGFNTGYDDEYGEGEYVYRADNGDEAPNGKWRPSTHMPRAAMGIKPATICNRLYTLGWTLERALTEKTQPRDGKKPWISEGMSRSAWYRKNKQ